MPDAAAPLNTAQRSTSNDGRLSQARAQSFLTTDYTDTYGSIRSIRPHPCNPWLKKHAYRHLAPGASPGSATPATTQLVVTGAFNRSAEAFWSSRQSVQMPCVNWIWSRRAK